MADAYTYQRKRKEFGRHAQFEDTDTKIVGSVPPDTGADEQFVPRDPNKLVLSNIPVLSQHSVSNEETWLTMIYRSTPTESQPAARE